MPTTFLRSTPGFRGLVGTLVHRRSHGVPGYLNGSSGRWARHHRQEIDAAPEIPHRLNALEAASPGAEPVIRSGRNITPIGMSPELYGVHVGGLRGVPR